MTETVKLGRRQAVLLLIGVMLAAFLGIIAGSLIIRKRTTTQQFESSILPKVGQAFPEYSFVSLDGIANNLSRLLQGKKSVLIFLTTDCPHCEHLISRLDSAFNNLPSEYQIVGISFETLEKLKNYRLIKNLSIPLYNDLNGKFTGKYKIEAFPTAVGVDDKGKVAFVEVGSPADKTVQDYLEQL